MEEEQDVDLASVSTRNTYARMVSWEFSNYDARQPITRRKKSKKSLNEASEQEETTQDDLLHDMIKLSTGSGTESEDSEYFSAEESVSVSDSDLGDGRFLLCSDLSDSDTATDSVFSSSAGASACSGESKSFGNAPVITRHRAPSKKQKRKRRQYYGNEYFFPFSGFDHMDVDFEGLREDVKLQGDVMKVTKNVPSLVDLCIIASQKLGGNLISQTLPPSMKKVMEPTVSKINHKKIQMSWILRLLSYFEPKQDFEERYLLQIYVEGNLKRIHLMAVSNVFSNIINLKYEGENEELFNGSKVSSYLPDNSQRVMADISYRQNNLYYWYSRSGQVLSVVASLMNLMFPPAIRIENKIRGPSGNMEEADMLKGKLLKIIDNIRCSLKKRYPSVTEFLFDKALPYMFWARGDVSNAAECFATLAEKENRGRFCAMYLYEIGHMYLQFHEMELAAMFFKRSADAAVHKPKSQTKEMIDEVDLQKALLIADIYDQGVMTTLNAKKAASLWQQAVKMPASRKFNNIGVFAVDSMLCFHGYCEKDDIKTWLNDVIKRMTDMAEQHPVVYLFLAMAHAWNGDSTQSTDAYRNFLHTEMKLEFDVAPGNYIRSSSRKFTPWDKLVQTVKTVGTPKPLNVIWRTRLLPPKFVDKNQQCTRDNSEADLCSRELNLHMNDDGYITGDMQLLFPPVYKVQLDPYTGVLCPPNVQGETETWKSFKSYKNSGSGENMGIVYTPLEVYHDNKGNRVHLIRPDMSGVIAKSVMNSADKCAIQILTWTGADGKKAKFNIHTKALDAMYKNVKAEIEGKFKDMTDSLNVKKKNLCLEVLTRCYNKGWIMLENEITKFAEKSLKPLAGRTIKNYLRGRTTIIKKPRSKPMKSQQKFIGQRLRIGFDKPVVFSKSALMIPVTSEANYKCITFVMFVDCSSRETFLQPKVQVLWSAACVPDFQDQFPEQMVPQLSRSEYEDLVCLNEEKSNSYVFITNSAEICDYLMKSNHMLYEDQYCHRPYIIQNFVLYINISNSLCSSRNSGVMTADFLGKVYRIDVCANVVIAATENGVKFLDITGLTPLHYSITKDPKPSLQDLLVDKKYCFHLAVIGTVDLVKDTSNYKLTALAYENHLILAEIPSGDDPGHHDVLVTLCIEVLGHAREICFLKQTGGFLLSVTQHTKTYRFYRDHIYHYNYHGEILGILPCLGPGPRSFYPICLPINPNSEDPGERRWHVYMRDGHGAIICCRLHC